MILCDIELVVNSRKVDFVFIKCQHEISLCTLQTVGRVYETRKSETLTQ